MEMSSPAPHCCDLELELELVLGLELEDLGLALELIDEFLNRGSRISWPDDRKRVAGMLSLS